MIGYMFDQRHSIEELDIRNESVILYNPLPLKEHIAHHRRFGII